MVLSRTHGSPNAEVDAGNIAIGRFDRYLFSLEAGGQKGFFVRLRARS
jgi:hypothetical protein